MISKERKEELLKMVKSLTDSEKDYILKAMNYDNRIIHFYNKADILFNFKNFNKNFKLTEEAVDDFISSKAKDIEEEYNLLIYQYILKYMKELDSPFVDPSDSLDY